MDNTNLILKITCSGGGPFVFYEHTVTISKDNEKKHFNYYRLFHDLNELTHEFNENFTCFQDAFNQLLKEKFSIIAHEIINIDDFYKFYYTKILMKQLHEIGPEKISQYKIENIQDKLDINLKFIFNPAQKGLKVIKIKGKKLIDGMSEKFFIGKLETLGNLIVIKNKNDEIDFMISNDEISNIKTEIIIPMNFWYFEKI